MDTLKVYKLKEEYRQLFTNLGSGGTFQVADAFAPAPEVPFQKGDAAKNSQRLALLEALVKAGLVEPLETNLAAKMK